MSDKLDLILDKLNDINKRLSSLENEMREGFKSVNKDVKVIREQTAQTTELQSPVSTLQKRMDDLETDVKLLKKVL